MLTIPATIQALYKSDRVRKNFRAHFPNGEYSDITNDNIVSESVKFTESVCSQDVFRFGCAESSVLEFETVGVGNMYGMTIEASFEIDTTSLSAADIATIQAGTWDGTLVLAADSDLGYGFFRIPLGTFVVESCPRNNGAITHRQVTAYTTRLSNVMQPFEYWKQNDIAYASTPQLKYHSLQALLDANIAWKTPDVLTGRYTKTKYTNKASSTTPETKFIKTFTLASGTLQVQLLWTEYYYTVLDALVLPTNVNISSVELDDFSANGVKSTILTRLTQMGIASFYDFLVSQLYSVMHPYIYAYDNGYDTDRNYVLDGSDVPYIYPPAFNGDSALQSIAWVKMGYVYAPVKCRINFTYNPTGGSQQYYSDNITLSQSGDAIACYYYHKIDTSNEQAISFKNTGSFQNHGTTYYTYSGSYSFLELLNGYAEMRGMFARETRTGSVEIKALSTSPRENILPENYIDVWWDEFDVAPIGSVIAAYSTEEDDITTSIRIGSGKSVYEMLENGLLKSLADGSEAKVASILQGAFATNAANVGFTPIEMQMIGLPWIEAGDPLHITAEDGAQVDTFALRIEMAGVQHLVSTITAQGGEIVGGQTNSVEMSYGSGGGVTEQSMKTDFLWENPSPSSSFAAQTVSLDLTPYKYVIIVATATTSDVNGGFAFGRVGDGIQYNIVLRNYNTSSTFAYVRRFEVTTTGVTFETGIRDTTEGTGYAIPKAIYGVRL